MKYFLLLFFLIFIYILPAFSLDVVYPSQNKTVINAPSTFIFGNTDIGSSLTINSTPVKIWNEGIFVHVVPLHYGENIINIKSQKNGKKEEVIYSITRKKYSSSVGNKPIKYISNPKDTYLYTKTIKDNSTIREKPSSSSKRVIDIPKGVVLYLAGQFGDYYKIDEIGDSEFWIHKSNIEEPIVLSKKMYSLVSKTDNSSDELYDYTKIYTSHPVMYTANQIDKNIKLTLYGTEYKDQENLLNNLEFIFETDSPVLGYEGYYVEDNKFLFKRAKLKKDFDIENPLKGIKIFIDAGHGGKEKGAIGTTRIEEKNINLAIAKKLINMLYDSGADVSYSRIDDRQVNLYERVRLAKYYNALISLSIHCNSLPNGKDPYIMHGTEAHYYNDNAKLLGEIIKNNLANDLNLKDNGLRKSSFALNRSTNPVSILVEVAYMINPEEYLLLKNDDFQTKVAKSLKKSLEEYLILIYQKKNMI